MIQVLICRHKNVGLDNTIVWCCPAATGDKKQFIDCNGKQWFASELEVLGWDLVDISNFTPPNFDYFK